MHGIKVIEINAGARPIKAVVTSIIGIVATAGATEGAETTKLDGAFPIGKRTLVTDIRAAIANAGSTGTLRPALEAIADQTSAVVVVVRVDVAGGEEEDPTQDELVEAGLDLFLGAESQLGFRPRIIGAPGLDTLAVTTKLATIARQLRAMAYAMVVGDTIAAAATYREGFSARELMLLWPGFSAGGADTVARALGLRARIDQEIGWHKTLSNVAVDGVTGLAKDVSFDIVSDTHDAALLNAADITTMIRYEGYRFWGNRTCSDEPLFAFESAVRTSQVLKDMIGGSMMWGIDKPLTKVLIKDIIETANAGGRSLVGQGYLIGFNAWYDPSLNSEADLAAGKLVIDYDFTPCAPLESLTLIQRITDRYYGSFADLAA